jgi:transcriptional regulator of acetoin/glycerol metabolism
MGKTLAGQTTRPSANASGDGRVNRHAAIRWVSPRTGLSLLEDGHLFGRLSSCDSVLDSAEVSRKHARIARRGLVPILADLESRNGIYVNGVRERERAIGPDDVVRIGDWVGVVVEVRADEPRHFQLAELYPGWYGGRQLAEISDSVRRVAKTRLPVVVQGETGTGKEGVARALHAFSERPGALVAVDCGALPEQLAEGALFGYRKGAFTGADRAHDGYFCAAERGTLFLDEISNLSLSLQMKLLRVLESGEVVPLGHSQPRSVDVRVVCAAQDSLPEAVERGAFRADLLARLDGLTVVLPPLRERREDIVPLFETLLAERLAERTRELEPRFVEALLRYEWPLNVRELVRLVERLVALHGSDSTLRRSMLPERMIEPARPSIRATATRARTDDPEEFERLLAALRESGGNLAKAASAIGVTRARAYRLIQAHPEFDLTPLRKPNE